jgi:hypothetical protein
VSRRALLEAGVTGCLPRPEVDDAALWHRAAVAAIRRDIRPLLLAGLGAAAERVTWAKRPGDILREYCAHLEADPKRVREMVDEQFAIERFERLLLLRATGVKGLEC